MSVWTSMRLHFPVPELLREQQACRYHGDDDPGTRFDWRTHSRLPSIRALCGCDLFPVTAMTVRDVVFVWAAEPRRSVIAMRSLQLCQLSIQGSRIDLRRLGGRGISAMSL